jgi:glycosyltransferase involved in cell wall biosynthesis
MRAIVIPTWNRLNYLDQVIEGLLDNDIELLKKYTLIFSCEPDEDVSSYLEALEFPCDVYVHKNVKPLGCIRNTYNAATLGFVGKVDFVIYLEDDTVPAPDLLNLAEYYYNLPDDPEFMYYSFYAIEQGEDSARLHETDWFSGWGFCMKRYQWKAHFKDVWPTGWDTKMLAHMRANNLKGLYPEVSRIKNIGEEGTHYNPSLHEAHGLSKIRLNDKITKEYYISENNKSMKGQHGEAQWLADYLVSNEIYVKPVVVDVGAGDGVTMSNSQLFIEKYGYKGYLIDANKTQLAKAAEHYNGVKNIRGEECEVEFDGSMVAGKRYRAVLTPSGEWPTWHVSKSDKKGDEYTTVLSKLVKGWKIEHIGIMNIDVEGLDTEIAKQYLGTKSPKPEVIIIEGNTEKERSEQSEIITKAGYTLIHTANVNQIFILNKHV